MQKELAKIEKVELREVWKHETEFTNWLAEDDGLALLSEAIDVELTAIRTEASVGSFSVDILAEDADSSIVVIENQIEKTDHDHLGKIITYASGYNAKIVIWIVSEARDEHKKAVEWLNEHSDQEIGYFLVKIELWKIGKSEPAPKFMQLVSPNEWAKAAKASADKHDPSIAQRQKFWNDFQKWAKKYSENRDRPLTNIKRPGGKKKSLRVLCLQTSADYVYFDIGMYYQSNEIRCGIYVEKKIYDQLQKDKQAEIKQEFNTKVHWLGKQRRKHTSIIIKKEIKNIFDENNTEEIFQWFYENGIKWRDVFNKYYEPE